MTQVLILGAGYAGMRTAKILAKKAPNDINITLIDKETSNNRLNDKQEELHWVRFQLNHIHVPLPVSELAQ